MDVSLDANWFSTAVQPLSSRFGEGLTLYRAGNTVRWGFAGQAAIVEFRSDGTLSAIFVDRERLEAVAHRPAAAAYRAQATYALTAASCSCMINDMAEFFSGVREPKFTFVQVEVG